MNSLAEKHAGSVTTNTEDGKGGSRGAPLVIGIGASAGGLEAFQSFVRGLPDEHDMAVVLIQHLDPDHESLMPELITKRTKTTVVSVKDGMELKPGHIYLMPPAYEMDIIDGRLRLVEFEQPRGIRRPINRFFTSLAAHEGMDAVAIVLSGTGSDGTEGVEAIKEAGGVVLVQDPKEARYEGMPQSVIDVRAHDMVVQAADMVEIIRDYCDIRKGVETTMRSDGEVIDRIIRHVKYRTGHDFSGYKMGSIIRRVTVRMSTLGIDTPSDYLRSLVEDSDEAHRLFESLLINVTAFFRDDEVFETLKKITIPALVEAARETGQIRIWVPGCSMGQEAYSIGILVLEELERVKLSAQVMIFATDVDTEAIKIGRQGRYSQDLVDQVPAQYLQRHFTSHVDWYEVSDRLREIVRFSNHNFVRDPPFASIDLVSCRNVLIYMDDALQEMAMRVFHYSLRDKGILLLGPSENPRGIGTYFDETDARERLHVRNNAPTRPLNLPWSLSENSAEMRENRIKRETKSRPTRSDVSNRERVILARHMPPHIHIAPNRDVLYVSDAALRYLSLRSGDMTTQLSEMVHPKIFAPFRSILSRDFETQPIHEAEFEGTLDDEAFRFVLTAEQLEDRSILLVIRDRLDLMPERVEQTSLAGPETQSYIFELETRLDAAKGEISSTVEELETSNEELKSSNEEMMSMNEELQSANEELTTINDELQENLRALKQANDDIGNFMRSANVAFVALTRSMEIRTFSPDSTRIFSFDDGDQGRPMAEFNADIDTDKVLELCRLTVEDSVERIETISTRDGERTFRLRVMPYLDQEDNVEGVTFALDDTTELMNAIALADAQKETAEIALEEVEQLYAVSPQAMTLIDKNMQYLRVNPKMAEINGYPQESHIGRTIREMIPDVADDTGALIREVLDTGKAISNMPVVGHTAVDPGNERTWETDWYPLNRNGEIFAVGVNVRDITEQVATAASLRLVMHELEHRVKNMLANVMALISRAQSETKGDTEVYEKLVKRIEGLSNTHSLLTAQRWTATPIRSVLEPETIAVYGQERITLRGPDIRINAESVLGLGMAIHELSTNAAKYGAFSKSEGHVTLSWKRLDEGDGDRLILRWQERGGPPVSRPEKSGFGSRLIENTIVGSLGGDVSFDWCVDGITCTIDLDYETLTKVGDT
jgi:two-component system CheB/CheR fusion protein